MIRLKTVMAGLAQSCSAAIYPEVCQMCGDETAKPEEGFIGRGCQAKFKPIKPPFCRRCGQSFKGEFSGGFECANCKEMGFPFKFARAAMLANADMLEVIHRFKYEQALWLVPLFERMLSDSVLEQIRDWGGDCLVPVPLHPVSFRQRGFNQAEQLCRSICEKSGLIVEVRAIIRNRVTQSQTLLSRSARAANVRGAFEPYKVKLDGRRVVLVDDVLTTGATTSDCARACKRAGAAEVGVWTLARGLSLPEH